MALTVVPEEKSTGQIFANQLATGLGSSLGQVAGKGIGSALGALGTGLGQMTGLIEKPKQLDKKTLMAAGFSEADADLILSSPDNLKFKLMEALAQKAPVESEENQQPEMPIHQEQQPEELEEEGELNKQPAAKVHPEAQRIFDLVDKESRGKEEKIIPVPKLKSVVQSNAKGPSLGRPTRKEVEMEKRRMLHDEKEDKKIALSEDKLLFQKEEAAKKAQREMSKEDRKEQHYIDAQTKPFYDKVSETYKEARKTGMRTGRMTQLIDNGELTNSIWSTFVSFLEDEPLGKHGPKLPPLNILRSASDVEFNKLSKDFLKGAKAIFGSRITEGEIKLFLQTVPDLNMTDEGKKRIIHNMELFSKAARIEYDIMNEIIEANGGNRPKNLDALVSKRADPLLDALAEEFKKGAPKSEKPKEETKQQDESGGKPLSSMLVNKIFG